MVEIKIKKQNQTNSSQSSQEQQAPQDSELKPQLVVRVVSGTATVSREQVARGMLWKLKQSLQK